MRESELEYTRRRAGEETEAARHSLQSEAAAVHRQLALAYVRKAAEMSDAPFFHMRLAG